MDHTVRFIDTSVLCNLIDVPGKNQHRQQIVEEFKALVEEGRTHFVIPVTSIVETGNHIANAKSGDRRAAALRLDKLLEQSSAEESPWQLHAVTWDRDFLSALRDASATGSTMVDHLGNGTMGTGDLAILTERDAFRRRTGYTKVAVWTLEKEMGAYA